MGVQRNYRAIRRSGVRIDVIWDTKKVRVLKKKSLEEGWLDGLQICTYQRTWDLTDLLKRSTVWYNKNYENHFTTNGR